MYHHSHGAIRGRGAEDRAQTVQDGMRRAPLSILLLKIAVVLCLLSFSSAAKGTLFLCLSPFSNSSHWIPLPFNLDNHRRLSDTELSTGGRFSFSCIFKPFSHKVGSIWSERQTCPEVYLPLCPYHFHVALPLSPLDLIVLSYRI